MKKSIIPVLAAIMIISSSFAALAQTPTEDSINYYNIMESGSDANDEMVGIIRGADSLAYTDNVGITARDIRGAYGLARSKNIGSARDYCNYNKKGNTIRAYARTIITGLKPSKPTPQWSIAVKGNLAKNGSNFTSAPSTKGAVGDLDVRSNTPYVEAVKGDKFKFVSFHYVYDYNGDTIWNKSHTKSKTF